MHHATERSVTTQAEILQALRFFDQFNEDGRFDGQIADCDYGTLAFNGPAPEEMITANIEWLNSMGFGWDGGSWYCEV